MGDHMTLSGRRHWLFAALASAASPALASTPTVDQLRDLSIEELANLEVTSASRQAEPISEAPTAIYVITNDDILRSSATTLPDLLREAPNLQVQQIDASEYAISARGFNGYETSNKLLALIDGRTIYTPLHSGIFWQLHAPMLEDLQQVEVISGPGGTLYGPNAVNGVINITTKTAFDTIGGFGRGTIAANQQTAALRYGAAVGDTGAVRVYGNYHNRDGYPAPDGGLALDDRAQSYQLGFRTDFGAPGNLITLQGDLFDTDSYAIPGDGASGHNLLARWSRSLGPATSFQLQGYYDKFEREFTLVRDSLETFDLQGQVNADFGAHDLVAGVGVRTTRDEFINNLNPFQLDPTSRRLWVYNFFVQDRFALTEEVSLIAGAKLEQSSFTGLQFLPNLRLAWQPSESSLLWAAVSRAVRTPSRIDRELQSLPFLAPATAFRSEKLTAVEAGYRGQPTQSTSLSVSLFYNLYDDIRTTEFAPDGGFPIRLANSLSGTTYGVEAWATQQVTPWWRLRLGLATLGKDFEVDEGRSDLTNGGALGNDADYKFLFRSQMHLGDSVDLDIGMRAVDDLDPNHVPAYVEADARIGWRVSEALELYAAGSHLLHEAHRESGEPRAQLVERSVYAGTRLRF